MSKKKKRRELAAAPYIMLWPVAKLPVRYCPCCASEDIQALTDDMYMCRGCRHVYHLTLSGVDVRRK